MADELVTFKLEGAITLAGLRDALAKFDELASAIAEEVAPDEHFEWVIEELEAGSATAGFKTKTDRPEYGAEVRLGIITALDAAKDGRIVPFRPRVDRAAHAVLGLGTDTE